MIDKLELVIHRFGLLFDQALPYVAWLEWPALFLLAMIVSQMLSDAIFGKDPF